MSDNELRTIFQVAEDGLWPSADIMGPDPEQSARHAAIAHVLCRIPNDAYQVLKNAAESFWWFIPSNTTQGMIYPFPVTVEEDGDYLPYAKVLYLSPRLETVAWAITIGVVAHELAHIVLEHPVYAGADYDTNESEAWKMVADWGFALEARKCQRVHKWRESYERTMTEKLWRRGMTE
jgi:hypothetical protein